MICGEGARFLKRNVRGNRQPGGDKMKKNFGPKAWLYPMPVLIVGSYDANGNADVPRDRGWVPRER